MPRTQNESNENAKIGLLGGGQLARMLIASGQQLGLNVSVLSPHRHDPAVQITQNWIQGDPHHKNDLVHFLEKVDLVTFESEFVDVSLLKSAEAELKKSQPQKKISFFPSLSVMEKIQDRRSQKQMLFEHGLPTSMVLTGNMPEDHLSFFDEVGPLVYKKRFGGYDGYGTFIFKKKSALVNWISEQNLDDFIVEKFIPFKRELAFSVARNFKGQLLFFPMVETHQTRSRCDWVIGPVSHPKFSTLKKKVALFLKKIGYVGVIAFELFDTGKDLIINEVAPRVHNSAHYSQDALTWSQFELHLMCGVSAKLPEKNDSSKSFAMLNLLGTSPECLTNCFQISGHLHWYGKLEARPGRKMGHINFTSSKRIQLTNLLRLRNKFFPHQLEKEKPS